MRCKYCGEKLSEYCGDKDCEEDHRRKLFDEGDKKEKNKSCEYPDCNKKGWVEYLNKQEYTIHNFCKKHQKEAEEESNKLIKELKNA